MPSPHHAHSQAAHLRNHFLRQALESARKWDIFGALHQERRDQVFDSPMATMPLDRERMGLIAVAGVGGFMAGVILTRYLSSSNSSSPVDQAIEQSETPDAMSLVDTPRSMDSSASFAFQPKASRFSSTENSSIENGVANGDSRSSGESRLALIVRMDLDMVGPIHCSLTLPSPSFLPETHDP